MTEALDVPAPPPMPPKASACGAADIQDGGGLQRMVLPESLTSRHAGDLFSELQASRGQAIVIDATAVRQVGTLCLQVLASARRTWISEGLDFRLSGASEDLSKQWELFGLPVGEFMECVGR